MQFLFCIKKAIGVLVTPIFRDSISVKKGRMEELEARGNGLIKSKNK